MRFGRFGSAQARWGGPDVDRLLQERAARQTTTEREATQDGLAQREHGEKRK